MSTKEYALFEVTPEIEQFAKICEEKNAIDKDLYGKYEVKRGLRDLNGKGVLAGLTNISDVCATKVVDGKEVPCAGNLYYRGYNIKDLVRGFLDADHYGFEEITYLLLFGDLPSEQELATFHQTLVERRTLPPTFVRDVIMKAPSRDMMNSLATSVLTLYTYDDRPEDISIPNVIRQCLSLIARFPSMMVYGFQSYAYYYKKQSLIIHAPRPDYSLAQNILYMLRPDSTFTSLEAMILDVALVLHAEHGGGNNSTFTNHVVTSSGTDTYSAMVASLCSLKGPRHGGANIKVVKMFDDMEQNISDWTDDDEIHAYIKKLLNKEAFDRSGLVYGMGHAVYSLSDPRALILRSFTDRLAEEKGSEKEYGLYKKVERIAPQVIGETRKIYKGVSANIDFYSGFLYRMLNLPEELYTPLFAAARLAGWSAHRIEELVNGNKIIRPAYHCVQDRRDYVKLEERK